MLEKDYKEIIYEIRGSDLPPQKLKYTIPEGLEVQIIPPGISGNQEEVEMTNRQRSLMMGLPEENSISHKVTHTLCSCKTNDGTMHRTKLVKGVCKFCKSKPFYGEWKLGYKEYNPKWDNKATCSRIKTQEEKDNFLAIAKSLRYNKTHIAKATGLHINTVRYRLKNWRKDV